MWRYSNRSHEIFVNNNRCVLKHLVDVLTLVAEDATPVRIAYALPGRTVAVSVFTAGIRRALITEFTSPTGTTPVTKKGVNSINTRLLYKICS